jgi:CDP-diglyceride synthetase
VALGNLAQRFLVALVAVPILLVVLYYHRPEPTWALIFAASLIAMHELFAMMLPAEDRRAALVMGGLAVAAFYWLDPLALAGYGDAGAELRTVFWTLHLRHAGHVHHARSRGGAVIGWLCIAAKRASQSRERRVLPWAAVIKQNRRL